MSIPTMGNPYAFLSQMLICPITVQRIAAIEYPQITCIVEHVFQRPNMLCCLNFYSLKSDQKHRSGFAQDPAKKLQKEEKPLTQGLS